MIITSENVGQNSETEPSLEIGYFGYFCYVRRYRLLHGWWARTIFIHELWRIANERASLRASEFAILHNKWIKIVQAN